MRNQPDRGGEGHLPDRVDVPLLGVARSSFYAWQSAAEK